MRKVNNFLLENLLNTRNNMYCAESNCQVIFKEQSSKLKNISNITYFKSLYSWKLT